MQHLAESTVIAYTMSRLKRTTDFITAYQIATDLDADPCFIGRVLKEMKRRGLVEWFPISTHRNKYNVRKVYRKALYRGKEVNPCLQKVEMV